MSTSATAQTVGLDIGGTKVLGVLLDSEGTVVAERRQLSPHAGVDALVDTATAIVQELAPEPMPVGVGAAGMVSHDGHVLYSPHRSRRSSRP
jgi:glucokinase